MEITINNTWDGKPVDHDPVQLKLSSHSTTDLVLTVEAPYYNGPPPSGEKGCPFPELWNYEVVELFLLNKDDQYLEIELCPHGQHLVLLLNGRRNIVKDQLSLKYTSSITNNATWCGEALIPLDYLPPNVNRFNAYSIHGTGENRVYEAFSPAVGSFTDPDFHRLEFFKPCDMSIFKSYNPTKTSNIWSEILST